MEQNEEEMKEKVGEFQGACGVQTCESKVHVRIHYRDGSFFRGRRTVNGYKAHDRND